jgi:hypothetical protein
MSGLWPWEKSSQLLLLFIFFILFLSSPISRGQSVNWNETLRHPEPLTLGKPPYAALH